MPEPNESLSEREQEILRLVATGAANKEIAHQLAISPNTVKVHVRNIFAKIGVASRTEATLYAIKIGLVQQEVEQPAHDTSTSESPAAVADSVPTAPPTEEPVVHARELPRIVVEDPHAASAGSRPRRLWPVIAGAVLLAAIALSIIGARLIPLAAPLPTVVSQAAPTPPALQRWSEEPSLPSPRRGMGIAEYGDAFYLVGGESNQGIDGTLLRFDPNKNTWETLAKKPTPVTDIQAALIGEKIYVPGGRMTGGKSTDLFEVYDPRADTWENRAKLPAPLSAYALASFEGKLYLFGGKNDDQYANTVYEYDPETDRWQERAPLSSPRAFAGAAVIGGRIHVLGGFDGEKALNNNEAYFPARDGVESGQTAWETFAPLPDERYAMGVADLAGLIFLLGGEGEQVREMPTIQYLPLENAWARFDQPPVTVRSQPALIAYGNFLYVIGGISDNGLSAAAQSYQAIYTLSVPLLQNE